MPAHCTDTHEGKIREHRGYVGGARAEPQLAVDAAHSCACMGTAMATHVPMRSLIIVFLSSQAGGAPAVSCILGFVMIPAGQCAIRLRDQQKTLALQGPFFDLEYYYLY